MMVIDNKYEIGQFVYLVTDTDQNMRLVTGLTIRIGLIVYLISLGKEETGHYEFELSAEKDYANA